MNFPTVHFDIYIQGLFGLLFNCVNIAISAKVLIKLREALINQATIMEQLLIAKHTAQQAVNISQKTDNQVGEVKQQIDTNTASIIEKQTATSDSGHGVLPVVNIEATSVTVNEKPIQKV